MDITATAVTTASRSIVSITDPATGRSEEAREPLTYLGCSIGTISAWADDVVRLLLARLDLDPGTRITWGVEVCDDDTIMLRSLTDDECEEDEEELATVDLGAVTGPVDAETAAAMAAEIRRLRALVEDLTTE